MNTDLELASGCTVIVRSFPISAPPRIALLLDMGFKDGRITPEVLLTLDEARALAARLTEVAGR